MVRSGFTKTSSRRLSEHPSKPMSKKKTKEKDEKEKSSFREKWGPSLLGLVTGLAAEIIVGVFTLTAVLALNIFKWYYSILISLVVGVLYGCHNKAMLERSKHETEKGMQKVAKDVNNLSNNVIPKLERKLSEVTKTLTKDVIETMYRFPAFVSLGNKIEKSKNDCDSEIVECVLNDQVGLLEKKEHILTIKGYLELLRKFANEHEKLYCVNITPPVFWFSGHPRTRKFVEAYALGIKTQRATVHRLTRIDKKELLYDQFGRAFDEIDAKWHDELLPWCLVLFQQLLDNGDSQISSFVMENLSDASVKETFKMIVLESTESERIELGFLHDITEEKRQELSTAIRAVRNSPSHCETINQRIVREFVEHHKEEGSLFITTNMLAHAFKDLFDIGDYGELGVYVLDGKPCKAFATIGEFGSLIKIKSMSPPKVFSVLQGLFKKATKIACGPEIGNMKYLYEG